MEKSKLQFVRASLWAMSLVICFSITSFGQVSGTISGTVADVTGAVLPGVEVTATNAGTGLARTVISNENGVYVIPVLPVGEYRVAAGLPGFQTGVREGLELNTDDRIVVNFALQVGSITTEILVTGSAPLIQSETSEIGAVIENQRIIELPLNGREFQQLALLVPGTFTPPAGSSNGFRGGISIAGSRERDTGYFIDGINMVDTITSSVIFRPSIDMIQEFKVHTSRYSAEVGRNAGGHITVTTKSGTNQVHGAIFEFVRNDMFDAKNFFDPHDEPIPPFTRNQFGGTVGGPLIQDKTFFLFNVEVLRLNQAITRTARVPTVALKRGDFSELSQPVIDPFTEKQFPGNIIPADRISAIGQKAVNWYPDPNLSGARNFVSTPSDTRDIDQYTIRIDHRFSESNNFFGRFSRNVDLELDPFDQYSGITNLPQFGRLDDQTAISISLVDNHVFSPNLVGEFRLGYNRFHQFRSVYPEEQRNQTLELGITGTTTNPVNFGFPTFTVNGFDTLGKSGNPSDRDDNHYQAVGNLTWTTGNHTFKFGTDISWQLSDRINNSNSRGIFRFDGRYTGHPLADLLMGFPRQTSRRLGESKAYPSTWVFGHFLQDDWKITPRLTLNLGVRYDFSTSIVSASDRQSRFNPDTGVIEIAGTAGVRRDISRPDQNLGGPDYTPDLAELAKTVTMIDTGKRNVNDHDKNDFAPRVGLAYRLLDNDRLVLRTGYGIYYSQLYLNFGGLGIGRNYPFKVFQVFNANPAQPNITIDNPFPVGLGGATITPQSIRTDFRTAYVHQYNFGFQFQTLTDLVFDLSYVGSKSTKLERRPNINQAVLGPGSVASRRPYPGFGSIGYLEPASNAVFNSLQLSAERRYTDGLTLLTAYTWSKSIDDYSGWRSTGDNGVSPNSHDWVGTMRGLSNFDIRHRLVFSYVYELPMGSGKRLLGNAQGIGSFLVSGWQISGITTFQTGPPITVRLSQDISNTGVTGADRPNQIAKAALPRGERTIDRWFNTAAFTVPQSGTFGNAGRGTITGPGQYNWDVSVMKNTLFGDGKNVQFRAEMFNIANHPQFFLPERNASSARFGKIFETALFSRQIQLGLKLIF
jgi:hypothetical protein